MDAVSSLHPTDQTLNAYGLGKLDDRLAEAVNKHLEQCEDCRKRVAEMSADSFLERVRDAQKTSGKSTFGKSQPGGTQGNKGLNAPSPPPANTLPPGLADHPDYEIKKELGRGGMGVVYLAHNKLMGRDEILKVMGRQIMERPDGSNASSARSGPLPSSATRTSSRPIPPSAWARASSSGWSTSKVSTCPRWSRPRGHCQWLTRAASFTRRPSGSSTPTSTDSSTAISSRAT